MHEPSRLLHTFEPHFCICKVEILTHISIALLWLDELVCNIACMVYGHIIDVLLMFLLLSSHRASVRLNTPTSHELLVYLQATSWNFP